MPHKRSVEKIIERRASQRAKRKANKEEALPVKRGRTLDPTPFIAILNIITRGKYLEFGKGFLVRKRLPKIYNEEVPMNRLREIRKEKGLSQLKLAFMTGISPWDISRIENGWIKPYPGWRKRLSKALGVSETELFPEGKSDAG